MRSSGPPPFAGLVAALVVLVAGVVVALTRHDTTAARGTSTIISPTRPSVSSTTTTTRAVPAASTTTTLAPLATTPTTNALDVPPSGRPAVASPEAAANGLWAAYSSGNGTAAARFASQEVIDALFAEPFNGEDGAFQGCRPRQPGLFDCLYVQSSARYSMGAQADAGNSFRIVSITIEPTG